MSVCVCVNEEERETDEERETISQSGLFSLHLNESLDIAIQG